MDLWRIARRLKSAAISALRCKQAEAEKSFQGAGRRLTCQSTQLQGNKAEKRKTRMEILREKPKR